MAQNADAATELARRRVFFYFSAFLLLSMAGDAMMEMDHIERAADDIAIVALALVGTAILYAWRGSDALASLKMQNNLMVALFGLMVIAKLYAVAAEIGTDDFGDEIPVLIGLVLAIANRFL